MTAARPTPTRLTSRDSATISTRSGSNVTIRRRAARTESWKVCKVPLLGVGRDWDSFDARDRCQIEKTYLLIGDAYQAPGSDNSQALVEPAADLPRDREPGLGHRQDGLPVGGHQADDVARLGRHQGDGAQTLEAAEE